MADGPIDYRWMTVEAPLGLGATMRQHTAVQSIRVRPFSGEIGAFGSVCHPTRRRGKA